MKLKQEEIIKLQKIIKYNKRRELEKRIKYPPVICAECGKVFRNAFGAVHKCSK